MTDWFVAPWKRLRAALAARNELPLAMCRDHGAIFAAPQHLAGQGGLFDGEDGLSKDDIVRAARDFIRTFRREGVFVYREALLQNYHNRRYYVEIDLVDLKNVKEALHDALLKQPNEILPHVELGAREALITILGSEEAAEGGRVPLIQVLFTSDMSPTQIRNITAADVNRMIMVPGIVINATRTKPRAFQIVIKCRNCGTERELAGAQGLGTIMLPKSCTAMSSGNVANAGNVSAASSAKCPSNPYVILPDKSKYMDQQTLKLQESPESVPTGEMPRHLLLVVERALADKIAPGTRIAAIGIVSTSSSMGGGRGGGVLNRVPYLRVVGVMVQAEGSGRAVASFTPEEEDVIRRMARDPRMYDRLAESIAPSISGDYTTDIKKAILCLLMGGSRKVLPDGMKLRGDINVLLLGDPSTAKSQFLKFAEKVAPVGVYTSGKGSSAAGLTAAVVRDKHGEFMLEGGAMVLADGGVVAIDEFDKMREEDRVAIHEAMEQQTISIAKAGITTILNSRTAVLAAANPVFGRYDDTRSAADNIDLLPTILSRFDLIFIVRDVRNEKRDQDIARHVLRVHINASAAQSATDVTGDIDLATLKKYITFARNKCAPRLSDDASRFLQAKYVEIRQEAKHREGDARDARFTESEDHGVIPITVRQLEALVRITEAVAKCSLAKEATHTHAEEALRLFRVATLNAAASGLTTLESYMSDDMRQRIVSIESRIARLVPAGGSVAISRVKEHLLRAGFGDSEVNTALSVMERRDEISLVNERKTLRRNK